MKEIGLYNLKILCFLSLQSTNKMLYLILHKAEIKIYQEI